MRALSGDLAHETLSRRCWRGESRAWIEVRGLDAEGDGELGRLVLDAVRAHPGVTSASLNYPLSRVVVSISGQDTSLRDLCRIVDGAEKRCGSRKAIKATAPPTSLPGDGVVLATRAVTVAANAAGLGIALTGRALRWPRMPVSVLAGVVAGGLPTLAAPCAREPHRPARDRHRDDAGGGSRRNGHAISGVIVGGSG